MLSFIIRLDDACPNMNKEKWDKVESILNKYSIKPIVGIIPDSQDKEFKKYQKIDNFWQKYAKRWQDNHWIIAQHGLHHNLSKKVRTEYAGKNYEDQVKNLETGYNILRKHGIRPTCFFAPAHTFDANTTRACRELGFFKYISDGVASYPYKKNGMVFLPNIFDTPHKILPFGVYTFVFHPNKMEENDYVYMESFISENVDKFNPNIDEIIERYSKRRRNILDLCLGLAIKIFRVIKRTER